jgi:hypothetical protein
MKEKAILAPMKCSLLARYRHNRLLVDTFAVAYPWKQPVPLKVKEEEELWITEARKQALLRAPDEYSFRTYLY